MDDTRRELLYKLLIVGDIGTGKTSIIKRYVHGQFSNHYKSTIGVDFALKVLDWDNKTTVRLQLWDIAGQERFGNMTRVYYKEAVGAFVVFDVTRMSTFEAVKKWKSDMDAKVQIPGTNDPIPVVLLANKIDLVSDRKVTKEEIQALASRIGVIAIETSAKTSTNIQKAFEEATREMLNRGQGDNSGIPRVKGPEIQSPGPAHNNCCT